MDRVRSIKVVLNGTITYTGSYNANIILFAGNNPSITIGADGTKNFYNTDGDTETSPITIIPANTSTKEDTYIKGNAFYKWTTNINSDSNKSGWQVTIITG
jgi:hypothetical protein